MSCILPNAVIYKSVVEEILTSKIQQGLVLCAYIYIYMIGWIKSLETKQKIQQE